MRKISIVSAGAWGTALAVPAAEGGHEVRLWRRTPGWVRDWDRGHRALPGLTLPANVHPHEDLAEALDGADLVILGSTSAGLRDHSRAVRPYLGPRTLLVGLAKGIEAESHLRMSEVIASELPDHHDMIAALSGPNFAHEVAAGKPTTTVVAARQTGVAKVVQDALMTQHFRIYTNPDLVGVELGGALKNIVALGVGICDGLGLGDNARAALITRGLTEMARLGTTMGANALTFAGLAGMGDLVLTCTSESSRNRRAGLAIGRGQSAREFVQETHLTVEGIPTTRAAWTLAQKLGVRMPITETIYRILYENLSPLEGTRTLMGRQKTNEVEEVIALNG